MKIPILHLEDGSHHFDGVIEKGTLDFYESGHYPHDIRVSVDMSKFKENITCKIHLETEAKFACDRCLEEFTRGFEDNFEILFHIGPGDFNPEEDDVVLVSPETKEIDFDERIIESLVLGVPMKSLCKEDCKGICPHCGVDLNKGACRCPASSVDPRWDELRKLLK
ncbi:MAG: DUF177 domain-containing protein [Calditrichia bacterium]